ncbi:hypothetical protein [Tenacibaculum aestuariivivum]|uniref:hypothetical protein n=1 Tax=Tenacibaculum aestuariivivum TaxID=2006131 RepID=UPI003AB64219
MINKTNHTINDFLNDDSFKNWALNSMLNDNSSFWSSWLTNNPDKKKLVEEAKDIIIALHNKEFTFSDEKVNFEWKKLEDKLIQKQKNIKK